MKSGSPKPDLRILLLLLALAIWPALPAQSQDTDAEELYIVQRGDTLLGIARRHGSTLQAFSELNDIDNPSLIYVGQQLRIPEVEVRLAPQPLPDFITPLLNESNHAGLVHRVAKGDNLSQIAAEYDLSLQELIAENEVEDASLLHVGQVIRIPGLQPLGIDAPWPEPVIALQVGPPVFREGESARIVLQSSRPVQVRGSFLDRALVFVADQTGQWHVALTGIPLNTEAGFYTLDIDIEDVNGPVSFRWPLEVQDAEFGREAILLSEDDQDTLDRDTENAERALLQHITSGFRPGRWFDGVMLRPSVGRIVSRFGTLRSYNRGPYDRVHGGVDFAAPTGTDVRAVADGLVVLALDLNVRGQSIMLDHGMGVYTGYWHLSEIYVDTGEFVRAGAVIGAMGNTGRSTGSHLHWQLWVNGTIVNPLQWLYSDFTGLGAIQE